MGDKGTTNPPRLFGTDGIRGTPNVEPMTSGIDLHTRSMRADAGVVISASHNPFQDNGIKFFASNGFKLPDELEREIERLVQGDAIAHLRPTARAVGKAFRIDDALGRYNV